MNILPIVIESMDSKDFRDYAFVQRNAGVAVPTGPYVRIVTDTGTEDWSDTHHITVYKLECEEINSQLFNGGLLHVFSKENNLQKECMGDFIEELKRRKLYYEFSAYNLTRISRGLLKGYSYREHQRVIFFLKEVDKTDGVTRYYAEYFIRPEAAADRNMHVGKDGLFSLFLIKKIDMCESLGSDVAVLTHA